MLRVHAPARLLVESCYGSQSPRLPRDTRFCYSTGTGSGCGAAAQALLGSAPLSKLAERRLR